MTKPIDSKNEESAKISCKKAGVKRGWDDIEQIFDEKKAKLKEEADQAQQRKAGPHGGSKARTKHRTKSKSSKDQGLAPGWVDDGLGGKYNAEGYTGRVEDGVKIFKAHVLNKPDAGTTDKCPFDCDCCFI